MQLVINNCFGGFSISESARVALGLESVFDADRYDSRLIKLVKEDWRKASGECAMLQVVEVPDEATDSIIIEHDCDETVWYVLDGKLYRAREVED